MEIKVYFDEKIPLRLRSEANQCEGWHTKYRRKKSQQKTVALYLNSLLTFDFPIEVRLTRIAPRKLDEQDNLPSGFKHIVDCIASFLIPGLKPGRADGDERISWKFFQEKGKPKEYAIRIEIMQRC